MTQMKQKTIRTTALLAIGGLAITLLATAGPDGFLARASKSLFENDSMQVNSSNKDYISKEKAVELALEKIETKATLVQVELDQDDKVAYFDVEMVDDSFEYEVEVNALSGAIMEFKKEPLNKAIPLNNEYITQDAAIAKALEKIGSSATLITIELDKDDTHVYYDIEMDDNTHDYEIEVDALTGMILDFDKDLKVKETNTTPPFNTNYITQEAAIKQALEKIGFQATLVFVELDMDDELAIYEIEMMDQTYEYEIEIDALTGAVLDFDKDALKTKVSDNSVVDVKYITQNQALDKAISRIGKTATLLSIELDKDDNPPKFEIEMMDETYEYDIEIHAISGVVLDFEKEID